MVRYDDFIEFKRQLNQAFAYMRDAQLVSRQNFSCCGGCACAEIDETLKKKPGLRGYAFYHRQDTRHLNDLKVFVSYGVRQLPGESDEGAKMRVLRIGGIVAECARRAGLIVDWDGKTSSRILLRSKRAA